MCHLRSTRRCLQHDHIIGEDKAKSQAGSYGITDGPGAVARFWVPTGIATDAAGNVYVVDSVADTIRKITPAGEVSTLAGAYVYAPVWATMFGR